MITLILPVRAITLLLWLLNAYRVTPAGLWRRDEVTAWANELQTALEYCEVKSYHHPPESPI